MNILIINGSPAVKSTTGKVIRAMADIWNESGHCTEILEIRDYSSPLCLGCKNCFTRGEEFCPHKARRDAVLEKMLETDALVLASPVYALNVSAHIKNLFDHLSWAWHRPVFMGKPAMALAVSSSGGPTTLSVQKILRENLESWGCNVVMSTGDCDEDVFLDKKVPGIRKARTKAAQSFIKRASLNSVSRVGLSKAMNFQMWKMVNTHAEKSSPCDYEYWKNKGWFQSSYYYPAPMSLPARLLAPIMGNIMKGFFAGMWKGYSS